jgi:multimeric flavodoxin WrbA
LSCGSEKGQCETFLNAAAIGAAEFGVETEIIRASTLNIGPWEADPNDDCPWIHEKALMEEAALICAVPCYHIRANALFYAINERMLRVPDEFRHNNRNDRVGAVIGVGGSGFDGWTNLTLPSVQIYMQHTRKIVDQIQYNSCWGIGLKEWNLWMQQGQPLTSNTHKQRIMDVPWEDVYTMWGEAPTGAEFYQMAIERCKEMGRNVARAMDMPIEEAEYKGEASGVECPVCHCHVLDIPENLPYVYCSVCAVRGTIVVDNGGMKLEWNMNDAKVHRFSEKGLEHHTGRGEYAGRSEYTRERMGESRKEMEALKESVFSQSPAKVVSPI